MEKLGNSISEFLKSRDSDKKYSQLMEQAFNDKDVQDFINKNKDKINPEAIEVSAASIYEFYNHKVHPNELSKGYVPQLVVSNHNIEVVYAPNKKTQVQERKSSYESKFVLLNMPSDIRKATLDDYDGSGRLDALSASVDFIENYDVGNFVPGLYLAGDFGVGKTYLLGAIANELIKKDVKTTIMHFPTFAIEMKNSIGQNNVLAQVNKVKEAEILMLDDIGADSMSSWIRDEVLGVILQYRMQENMPTFFSSNFTMSNLEKHLSINQRGEEEPVKAQRIMERIKYLSKEVIVSGPNKRFQK
ncbi:primosomal protein DnaI [Companilactobacillus allii]|uniref:Primosomal protein DnaI n=1 Tax=Companilactobacillus allii TaxID=1847728 RepID=A0A1P8Q3W9_9LACO|nr:primosomal protein DnaI [Companilactobacillus allii]APX72533.1 primosomal protein DnaI [Companilactobacillus allii]USQ69636.1 primosomal protein DnaI [Companilactobacillus allii]